MDERFDALAERISQVVTRNVTEAVTRDVTAAVTKNVIETVTATVTKNVTEAVTRDVTAAVTRDVTEAVTANVSANMSRELDVRFAAAEARLAEQARLHIDAVRQESRLAAEGYGATMDSIKRRLDRIERKVTVNHRDTVRILAEHHERISALESGRASTT